MIAKYFLTKIAEADIGGGSKCPETPVRPNTCLRLKFVHRQDRIALLNWLFFLMKRALHFATKLNSRDTQNCNCFSVPSHDLFASARKAVFPSPTATGPHRLRNTWSVLREVICHKKVQQSLLNQSLVHPPIKNSWIRP